MKKGYTTLLFFLLIVWGILSGFQLNQAVSSLGPAQAIKDKYLTDIRSIIDAARSFSREAKSFSNNSENIQTLQEKYRLLRKRYKQIEYLIDYLDPEFVKVNINGAPLPSLEGGDLSRISVLAPSGLQIIEEHLYSGQPHQHRADIANLSGELAENLEELLSFHRGMIMTDRHVFEAVRLHLIRVFTLGVSGFDSPAGHSILDASESLARVAQDFSNYYALIATRNPVLSKEIKELFEGSIRYTEANPDFETFDRAAFLRQYLDPLFAKILDAHLGIGLETYYETDPLYAKHSINYMARSIFAEDLLHKEFYMLSGTDAVHSQEVIDLGKVLFFDPILSANNERACASCHQPQKAFTDGQAKSVGMNFKGTVQRNSPTLVNAVYADRFFYDLRANDLESQIDHVVANHLEFATNFLDILEKLESSDEYKKLFLMAFPDIPSEKAVNKSTLSTAIGAYVASLSSFNSPFDQYMRGERKEIDQDVVDGFNIFMGKAACGTCHFPPTFNGLVPPLFHESESEVLGVPISRDTLQAQLDPDLGRALGQVREQAYIFNHAFKTTTVRNAALTAPYMHNGVYNSLEEVIDFYNKGGGHGLGLKVPNQTLPTEPLDLTDQEQGQLIAFIHSLTDTTGMNSVPGKLPTFPENPEWNDRVIGGKY